MDKVIHISNIASRITNLMLILAAFFLIKDANAQFLSITIEKK